MTTTNTASNAKIASLLSAEWETLNADINKWEEQTRATLPRGSRWPKPPAALARRLSAWRKGAKAIAGWDNRSRPVDAVLLYIVQKASCAA